MTNVDSEIVARAQARLGTMLRGKYRLDRVLGVGGMAVVYEATHRNQARFAIKMLHPELSLRGDIRSRFMREGYAANSVKHPGAVLVVDDDVAEDGAAFLVMELLDGVACEDLVERAGEKVTPDEASAILIQFLDVLAAAHANGIVHRDIKPANLFLVRSGLVKVLDFGIAKAREALADGARATGSGIMLGTPAYMSPEQAAGRGRDIDGRTDLWAAGATFFSLVSGKLVHEAETAHELMIWAATTPARALSTVAPHVPPALAAIVDRALAFRKEDRWATANEMRDALLKERRAGAAPPEVVVASLVPGSSRPAPAAVPASTVAATSASLAREREPRSRSTRWAALSVGIAIVGTAAWLGIGSSSTRSGGAGASGADAGGGALAAQQDRAGSSDARDSGALASVIASDAQASAASAVSVSSADVPVVPAATPAVPSPSSLAAPAPSPAHSPARPPARSPPRPTPLRPPKPDCDPNWYMEGGIKKYKPECPLN